VEANQRQSDHVNSVARNLVPERCNITCRDVPRDLTVQKQTQRGNTKMSTRSSALVKEFRKAALATVTPEIRKIVQDSYKEMTAHMRTIVDYRRVAKERALTQTEKQDFYRALEAERKTGSRWVVQIGIDCGIYALQTLVKCA
jgi:hypothetical protein